MHHLPPDRRRARVPHLSRARLPRHAPRRLSRRAPPRWNAALAAGQLRGRVHELHLPRPAAPPRALAHGPAAPDVAPPTVAEPARARPPPSTADLHPAILSLRATHAAVQASATQPARPLSSGRRVRRCCRPLAVAPALELARRPRLAVQCRRRGSARARAGGQPEATGKPARTTRARRSGVDPDHVRECRPGVRRRQTRTVDHSTMRTRRTACAGRMRSDRAPPKG